MNKREFEKIRNGNLQDFLGLFTNPTENWMDFILCKTLHKKYLKLFQYEKGLYSICQFVFHTLAAYKDTNDPLFMGIGYGPVKIKGRKEMAFFGLKYVECKSWVK